MTLSSFSDRCHIPQHRRVKRYATRTVWSNAIGLQVISRYLRRGSVRAFTRLTATVQEYLASLKYLDPVGRLSLSELNSCSLKEISICQLQPLLAKHGAKADSRN